MKKALNILLLSLCLVSFLYPQSSDLTKKFKKYIPQSVASKYIFMNSLDSKIIEIGKLDPRLLYSYLKNLDENWNKKLEIDSTNNINMFAYNLNVTLQSRSEWMKRNFTAGITSGHSKLLNRKINSFYPDYEELQKPEVKNYQLPDIDSNQVYYYAQLFYSDSVNQTMNPETNYKNIYTQVLKSKMSAFEQSFKNASGLSEDSLKTLYAGSMQYWYLFDNKYLADFNLTNSVNHREILLDRLMPRYKEYHGFSVGIMAYPLGTLRTHKFTYYYTLQNVLKPIDWEEKYRCLFTIEGKYLFPVKKEFATFSHIELGFGYTLSSNARKDRNYKELFSYTGAATGKYVTKKCSYVSDSLIHFSSFVVQLSTPIFYFTKDIFLVAGGEVAYISWHSGSKIKYSTEIEYVGSNNKEVNDTYTTPDYTEKKYLFLPFAEAHLRFYNNFELIVKYNTTIQTGLRYVFGLS